MYFKWEFLVLAFSVFGTTDLFIIDETSQLVMQIIANYSDAIFSNVGFLKKNFFLTWLIKQKKKESLKKEHIVTRISWQHNTENL